MGRVQAGPVDELLGIGEFSKRCGLSPKVLRTYAANGLLTPAAVDRASGYRYYAPGQIDDAQVIGLLRRAGVALVEIAAFLRQPTRARLQAWDERLSDEVRVRREALAEVAWRIDSPELHEIALTLETGLKRTGRSFQESTAEELTELAARAAL